MWEHVLFTSQTHLAELCELSSWPLVDERVLHLHPTTTTIPHHRCQLLRGETRFLRLAADMHEIHHDIGEAVTHLVRHNGEAGIQRDPQVLHVPVRHTDVAQLA